VFALRQRDDLTLGLFEIRLCAANLFSPVSKNRFVRSSHAAFIIKSPNPIYYRFVLLTWRCDLARVAGVFSSHLLASLRLALPFHPFDQFRQSLALRFYTAIYAADPIAHRQQQPSIRADQCDQRGNYYGNDGVNVHALH
jgi:hypothetical protein